MDLSIHIQREVGLPSTWTDPLLEDPNRPQAWWWETLSPPAAPPPNSKKVVVMSLF